MKKIEKNQEKINPGRIKTLFEDFERLFSEKSFSTIKSNFRKCYYYKDCRTFNNEDTSVTFQEIDEYGNWNERTVTLSKFYTPATNNIFTLLKEQIRQLLDSINSDEYLVYLKYFNGKIKKLSPLVKVLLDKQYKESLKGYLNDLTEYIDEFYNDFHNLNLSANTREAHYFHSDWFSNCNIDLVNTLYQELLDSRMISPISKSIFSKIFSDRHINKPPTKKINWLESEISFRYFINKLIVAKILAQPFSKQMRIANKCFSLKGNINHDWVPGGRSAKYKNRKSEVIDRIIELAKRNAKESN
jgi:hypothetical protein